jgi:hypothetical protein
MIDSGPSLCRSIDALQDFSLHCAMMLRSVLFVYRKAKSGISGEQSAEIMGMIVAIAQIKLGFDMIKMM